MSFRFIRAVPCGLALVLAVAASAQAQTLSETPAGLSAKCLKAGPANDLRLGDSDWQVNALVRLQLRFDSADSPPAVEVLFSNADPAVQGKVRAYVASYRLPCWTSATGPVTVTQEFSMRGPSQTSVVEPLTPIAAAPNGGSALLTDGSCRVVGSPMPAPEEGLDRGAFMLASFRFVPGRDEPEVEVKALTAPNSLQRLVKNHAKTYRPECTGAPNRGWAVFKVVFRVQGDPITTSVNKPFELSSWIGSLKNPARGKPYFDFNTMACPFSVALRNFQPLRPNEVEEVGPRNPNRQMFLSWLAQQSLNFPPSRLEQLLDQRVLIDIPCGVVDLR